MMTVPWVTYFSRCCIIYDRDVSMGRNCVIWCLRVGVCMWSYQLWKTRCELCSLSTFVNTCDDEYNGTYIYFLLQKLHLCFPACVHHHEDVWTFLLLGTFTLPHSSTSQFAVSNKAGCRQLILVSKKLLPQKALLWLLWSLDRDLSTNTFQLIHQEVLTLEKVWHKLEMETFYL